MSKLHPGRRFPASAYQDAEPSTGRLHSTQRNPAERWFLRPRTLERRRLKQGLDHSGIGGRVRDRMPAALAFEAEHLRGGHR